MLAFSWYKLALWNLTEYSKVFVFDADTLAMRNVSEELLLAHRAFSASAHVRGRYVNRYTPHLL